MSRVGMRSLWLVVPTLILLVLIFIVGSLLTIFVRLPYCMITWQWSKVSNIVQSLDRLCAAGLPFGWNGRKTISWECGGDDCTFCKAVCAWMNAMLEADHCRKERESDE